VPVVLVSVAFSALSAIVTARPVRANCYETFGCTDSQYFDAKELEQASCQILWEMRNIIYKERRYCFHTKRAIGAFAQRQLPVSRYRQRAAQRFRARQCQRHDAGRERQGLLTVQRRFRAPKKAQFQDQDWLGAHASSGRRRGIARWPAFLRVIAPASLHLMRFEK
jgi:hypothetical protein